MAIYLTLSWSKPLFSASVGVVQPNGVLPVVSKCSYMLHTAFTVSFCTSREMQMEMRAQRQSRAAAAYFPVEERASAV